ncbi:MULTISPECIES: hypothetical protein [Microbulbifer]|uniref:hypothetical protein n=1 Tax=Microbulbifer TaxID=48073 RepID=UPI001596F51B|nr:MULTISPECIES: hypothetical protein [Microbulbifer]
MTKTSIALTTKVWWLVSVAVISGCASAPLDYPKQRSSGVERTTDGREAAAVSAWLDGNADSNGFYSLIGGLAHSERA